MVGVILYTLMEFVNFYLAYRNVFGIRFTKRKLPYAIIAVGTCIAQMTVLYMVDDTWRDVVVIVAGLIGAMIITKSKRWKVVLLYPVVMVLTGFINILGSYGLAALLKITQDAVTDSIVLTLVSECTAIIVLIVWNAVVKKRNKEERSLTVGQYMLLTVGAVCFFLVISFSQGLLNEELDLLFLNKIKEVIATASVIIALSFMVLCIWQQITLKRVLRYQSENKKYEVFLAKQEEHIRMQIVEDENRRRLRHDMNAHMLALNTMAEQEEWDMLKEYIGQIKTSFDEVSVNKYTHIAAVDAIIDEWHGRAMKCHAMWFWEGTLKASDRVTIFELCTVFSNLLSNAVEAIEKVNSEKKIQVKVSLFQENIVISVGNTCDTENIFDSRPITTKEDKLFHGLGLKNVEEIEKKHQGSIDYEMKDGWFQVDIVL